MKLLVIVLFCAHLCGQSLLILPSPPSSDRAGTFYLGIASPATQSPASLQWRFLVPDGVTIRPGDIRVDGIAKETGKSLRCAGPRPASSGALAIVCVLVGGMMPLPSGTIARVDFTMVPSRLPVTVVIDQVLGATPDGKANRYPDSKASLLTTSPTADTTGK